MEARERGSEGGSGNTNREKTAPEIERGVRELGTLQGSLWRDGRRVRVEMRREEAV